MLDDKKIESPANEYAKYIPLLENIRCARRMTAQIAGRFFFDEGLSYRTRKYPGEDTLGLRLPFSRFAVGSVMADSLTAAWNGKESNWAVRRRGVYGIPDGMHEIS